MPFNELFLLLITVMANHMRPTDKPAAIVFVIMAYVTYFASIHSQIPWIYFVSTVSDVVLVVMLYLLRRKTKSFLASCLIPISLFYVITDFLGWASYKNDASIIIYNMWVVSYYAIIILLFAVGLNYGGDNTRHPSFFRRNRDYSQLLGKVSK